MRMADGTAAREVQVVSAGSLGLDIALGVVVCRVVVSSRFMVQNRR